MEEARTGVSGRRGALLELGFHFRKESGVTAIPGHRIVTDEKVCRHTAAFIKKKKKKLAKLQGKTYQWIF